ncbi:unnamed protein product [Ambrosiozyma monospora]|uniref:Unnamed protein product n=1 Tax=Ambrosiozyma monospora TaxID=43982 RepID=A0A9W7DFK0_AMBMO|nr:unnamed protein product [Ambrosiozyma monospora]
MILTLIKSCGYYEYNHGPKVSEADHNYTKVTFDNDIDYDMLMLFTDRLLKEAKYKSKGTLPALFTLMLLFMISIRNRKSYDCGDYKNAMHYAWSSVEQALTIGFHKKRSELAMIANYKDNDELYIEGLSDSQRDGIWIMVEYIDSVAAYNSGVPSLISKADPSMLDAKSPYHRVIEATSCYKDIAALIANSDHELRNLADVEELIARVDNLNSTNVDSLLDISKRLFALDGPLSRQMYYDLIYKLKMCDMTMFLYMHSSSCVKRFMANSPKFKMMSDHEKKELEITKERYTKRCFVYAISMLSLLNYLLVGNYTTPMNVYLGFTEMCDLFMKVAMCIFSRIAELLENSQVVKDGPQHIADKNSQLFIDNLDLDSLKPLVYKHLNGDSPESKAPNVNQLEKTIQESYNDVQALLHYMNGFFFNCSRSIIAKDYKFFAIYKAKIESSCQYAIPSLGHLFQGNDQENDKLQTDSVLNGDTPSTSSTTRLMDSLIPSVDPSAPLPGQFQPLPQEQKQQQEETGIITPVTLHSEMEEMRTKIISLENLLKQRTSVSSNSLRESISSTSSSTGNSDNSINSHPQRQRKQKLEGILNMELDSLKRYKIAQKPSRTTYYGPFSTFSSIGSKTSATTFTIFANFLESERNAYKNIHGKAPYMPMILNARVEQEEVLAKIENDVLPHCNALFSRISYFRSNLNDLLYNGFIDMPYVMERFHNYFQKTPDYSFNFVRPKKEYEYAELALIFAVVYSTLPFCDVDPAVSSSIQLPQEIKDTILQLCTDCYSISKPQRKHTFSALLTLVIIRDIFFTHSHTGTDAVDESKSYGVVRETIDSAYRLGLHRDPTTVQEFIFASKRSRGSIYHLPPLNSRALWSYLKMLDASYSIYIGLPLLISDVFSDSSLPPIVGNNMFAVFTDLESETAVLMNSVSPISLNDLLKLREKYLKLNSSFETFDELIAPRDILLSTPELSAIAHKLRLKLKLFRILGVFNSYLTNAFTDTGKYPTSQLTPENLVLLNDYACHFHYEFTKITAVIWKFLRMLCDGNTVFGDSNSFYCVYLKGDILPVLTNCFCVGMSHNLFGWFNLVFKKDDPQHAQYFYSPDKIGEELPSPLIQLNSLDYGEIETSMSEKISSNSQDTIGKKLDDLFRRPRQLIAFLKEVHESGCKSSIFSDNYGYFCLLKLAAIFCCFLDSMVKMNESGKSIGTGNLTEVIDETRKKINETMKLGINDFGFDLQGGSIDNWLDLLFDEETLSTFLQSADTICNINQAKIQMSKR